MFCRVPSGVVISAPASVSVFVWNCAMGAQTSFKLLGWRIVACSVAAAGLFVDRILLALLCLAELGPTCCGHGLRC